MGYKFKQLRIMVVIVSLFSITSCVNFLIIDPMYDRTIIDIILRNESGFDIRVESYYKKVRYDNITIKNNTEVVNHVDYKIADVNLYNIYNVFIEDPKISYVRDSVAIIFNEKKVIIQTCPNKLYLSSCDDIEKNLGLISIEKNKLHKNWWNAIRKAYIMKVGITLTKADYDRASPI